MDSRYKLTQTSYCYSDTAEEAFSNLQGKGLNDDRRGAHIDHQFGET
jgi:hypothetical protein